VCLFLGIIFWFALGFCKSVQSMVVVRALLGLGCSTGGVATAYLMALVPDETLREKVVGMQTKLSYLAASAGAGIGAMLFGLGGWEGLCAVMAALQLLQLVLGSMFWENVHAISDVVVEASGEGRRGAIHFMRHYSNRDIGPFLFLELINATVQAVFNACIVFVLVEQFSLDASEWMNLISQYCLFSLPFSLMAEFQIRMLGGYRRTILVANLSFGAVVLFLCFGPRNYYMAHTFLVLTFLDAAQSMSSTLLLQGQIPPELLNEVNGLVTAQNNLVMAVIVPLGGLLYDIHWNLPFLVVAGCLVVSCLILLTAPASECSDSPLSESLLHAPTLTFSPPTSPVSQVQKSPTLTVASPVAGTLAHFNVTLPPDSLSHQRGVKRPPPLIRAVTVSNPTADSVATPPDLVRSRSEP